ncbi:MAG: sigma-54 dependent transcriptional regulator [Phycisphaerae bacterium]|nr:sigma-54 dependent transcriptional regulator [Phycisphaerae bacterium]
MRRVLIVDDKQLMRDSVSTMLARAGYNAVTADSAEAAEKAARRHRPAVVITDLRMPGSDGLSLLERLAELDPDLPVILMTAYASVETAVAAMKGGAFDYIQKPFEGDELILAVGRAAEHHRLRTENAALKQAAAGASPRRRLVGKSLVMDRVHRQIEQIADSCGTVLVSGESGTGKEIVAHAIHELGPRSERPLLCLNCAALSTGLLESELFGHEKGAFTGADQVRKGRFELADGGTLLLDEISEISPQVQAKLLRVLQERQFERVGSSVTMAVDVRVIATTNRNLEEEARHGRFRQDLYYRLNVLPLQLPPLRARRADIPVLAEHFLRLQARRDGRDPKCIDAEAVQLLCAYPWPGNVRELENICQRAAVLTDGPTIAARTIAPWLNAPAAPRPMGECGSGAARKLEDLEREVIVATLGQFDGHRQRTAEALGIGVRTLGLKLKKWKEQELVAASL